METPETNPTSSFSSVVPRKPWQVVVLTIVALGFAGIGLLAILSLILTPALPELDDTLEDRLKVPMRVYTSDGVLIGEFGEERRLPRKITEVPPLLIQAILAAEDSNFYDHPGISLPGIARAAWANFQAGGHRQGASTITMQVARNFFLSPEKTYTRKIKEILLSLKLERELSKDEILELYINKIFLGHRAYGFAAAARIYYGKSLDDLTLPEMAMLAGLPKAPSRNNPLSNPDTAFERRNYILKRMHHLGYVDEAIYLKARTAPVSARKHALSYDIEAPYIAEMVRQYMAEAYQNKVYAGGFHVYTTIHSKYQKAANEALRAGVMDYERRHGYRGPAGHIKVDAEADKAILDQALNQYRTVGNLTPAVVMLVEEKSIAAYNKNGDIATVAWSGLSWAADFISVDGKGPNPRTASDILKAGDIIYLEKTPDDQWLLAQPPMAAGSIVALRPDDGAILALTGGYDFYQSKFNRAIQAERQPGSNIKPFIYSASLDKGFTAATTVSGAPIAIEDVTLEDVWRPENYSGKFFGPTRLRKALTLSLNLVSVRLLRAITPSYAVEYLERFGFDSKRLPKNLSLALGSASVTPITMVRAFTVFANGGYLIEPYFITRIEDGDHNILEQANPAQVCRSCPDEQIPRLFGNEDKESAADKSRTTEKQAADKQADTKAAEEKPAGSETGNQPQLPRYAPRAISQENAFIMTNIMKDVIREGTARRALVLNRTDLAGKTGTTNEFKDAWFSGFNSQIAATAWIGFDQPASLGKGEAGSRAALPMWIDFMKVALEDMPVLEPKQPESIVTRFINKETGQPTHPDDPEGMEEIFSTLITTDSEAMQRAAEGGDTALPPTAPGDPSATPGPQSPQGPQQLPEGLF